jgi:glycosyltransferase involved in cell wall biosynthesis
VKPLVSILVPCYNAEPWVAQTLRSALVQTWPRTEVIVVDDGSRDRSREAVRPFASARLKLICQENRGASAARNRALAEAQGDFIQFLDADDLIAPDKLEVQLRRLEEAGPDCVATCRWGRFHDDPDAAWFVPEPFWADLAPVDWLVCCWERASMMHPAAWLLPRGVAERAGPWDERLSLNDDGEYFSRVVLASRRVCFCPQAVTSYRSGLPGSLSGIKGRAAWDSALRALEAGATRLLAAEDSPRTRRACARQFQEFVYSAYPDCPDLLARAERRVRELGAPTFPPPGGPAFRLVSRLIGWRGAKRLQRLALRWGLRRARRRTAFTKAQGPER